MKPAALPLEHLLREVHRMVGVQLVGNIRRLDELWSSDAGEDVAAAILEALDGGHHQLALPFQGVIHAAGGGGFGGSLAGRFRTLRTRGGLVLGRTTGTAARSVCRGLRCRSGLALARGTGTRIRPGLAGTAASAGRVGFARSALL